MRLLRTSWQIENKDLRTSHGDESAATLRARWPSAESRSGAGLREDKIFPPQRRRPARTFVAAGVAAGGRAKRDPPRSLSRRGASVPAPAAHRLNEFFLRQTGPSPLNAATRITRGRVGATTRIDLRAGRGRTRANRGGAASNRRRFGARAWRDAIDTPRGRAESIGLGLQRAVLRADHSRGDIPARRPAPSARANCRG